MADNLATALAAFQKDLPTIGKGQTAKVEMKGGGSYSYAYADLADVSATVLPMLANLGLTFTARPTFDDEGRFVLAYQLLHTSGESIDGAYPLPNATPQQVGSAITYARRYCLCAVTGVAPDEDDDGRAAQQAAERPQEPKVDHGALMDRLGDLIGECRKADVEGDYDTLIDWAAESPGNAQAGIRKLEQALADEIARREGTA